MLVFLGKLDVVLRSLNVSEHRGSRRVLNINELPALLDQDANLLQTFAATTLGGLLSTLQVHEKHLLATTGALSLWVPILVTEDL